jgi:hypothetical protein
MGPPVFEAVTPWCWSDKLQFVALGSHKDQMFIISPLCVGSGNARLPFQQAELRLIGPLGERGCPQRDTPARYCRGVPPWAPPFAGHERNPKTQLQHSAWEISKLR